jgi:hypothetical protein
MNISTKHFAPSLAACANAKASNRLLAIMAIIADMNRGGSKPGERRGGRKKGSLNKATIERALMAEREIATASETRQKLAKDHLEELVDFYARMSISEPDEVEKWSKLRMEAASRLAPYQSPKLGVVMIEPPSEQDRLAQMTDEELIAALNSKADALGVEITIKPKGRRQLTLVPNNKSEECDG